MHIDRLSLAAGADAARGVAIIIDVFRAFTCEPLMYRYGAREVVLEADTAACLAMTDVVRIGEDNELPIPGFDLTNSPSLIMARGDGWLDGRRVVHRTSAGVAGAVAAALNSDRVLLASFVTARATAAYIARLDPPLVSIVAMGNRMLSPAPEDEFCGDYLEHLLTGSPYDHTAALAAILADESARKFHRGDKPHLPTADPAICLQRDLFDFALEAVRQDGLLFAVPR